MKNPALLYGLIILPPDTKPKIILGVIFYLREHFEVQLS